MAGVFDFISLDLSNIVVWPTRNGGVPFGPDQHNTNNVSIKNADIIDDTLERGSILPANSGSAHTVQLWFAVTPHLSSGGFHPFITQRDQLDSTKTAYQIGINGDDTSGPFDGTVQATFYSGPSFTNSITSRSDLRFDDGFFHLLQIVVNGNSLKIFIDRNEVVYFAGFQDFVNGVGYSGSPSSVANTVLLSNQNGISFTGGNISRVKFATAQAFTQTEIETEHDNECLTTIVNDPRAHYKLDEVDTTTAFDSSGNGFNGTSVSVPISSTNVAPLLAANPRSYLFDAIDDKVDLGAHVSNFPLGNSPRSISLWYDRTASNRLFGYGGVGAGKDFELRFDQNSAEVRFGNHIWGQTGLTITGYAHVFVTVPDGATMTDEVLIYLDNVLLNSITQSGSPQTLDTASDVGSTIGAGSDGAVPFGGNVDEVRIYNRALTTGQRCNLFLGGPPALGNGPNNAFPNRLIPNKAIPKYALPNGIFPKATI